MWKIDGKIGESVISFILFGLGGIWLWLSKEMPKGEFSVPGPGFFPTLIGILFCMISLALGLKSLFQKEEDKTVKIGHSYIWSTIIAIIVLSFLYEGLGFLITVAIFVGILLKILSSLGWKRSLFWGTVAAIASYLFFHFLLGLQLPTARWFRIPIVDSL